MGTVDFKFEYKGEEVVFEVDIDYVYKYDSQAEHSEDEREQEGIIEEYLEQPSFRDWLENEIVEEYECFVARNGKVNAERFFKNWR